MASKQLYREVLLWLLASPSDQGCRQDVPLLYHHLGRRKCRDFNTGSVEELEQKLKDCGRLFKVEINSRGDHTVSPRTALAICRTHCNKGGSCPERTCPDLHFCVFFLLSGECSYGDRCHFGHELKTAHNEYLLQRHLLWGLNITDLRTLFCLPGVRQGVTLPQVCKYYNVSKGCTKQMDCHALHLCRHYVLDQCKFGVRCERNHNINDPQVMKVLTLYGVKVNRNLSEVLRDVRDYNRKREAEHVDDEDVVQRPAPGAGQRAISGSKRPRNSSESSHASVANSEFCATKTEICLYHLKGTCKYGEDCHHLHTSESYLWRLANQCSDLERTIEWKGLPPESDLMLEEAYSQPQETACTVVDEDGEAITVNFRCMTAENKRTRQQYRVRRVSTRSFKDPSWKDLSSRHYRDFATVWLWYWRDQNGDWTEFNFVESGGISVTSEIVEEKYQLREGLKFDHFILDLDKMRLKDSSTNKKFKVRRRPQLVQRNHDAESHSADKYWSDPDMDDEERGAGRNDADGSISGATASGFVADDDEDSEARANEASASVASVDKILSPIHSSSQKFMTVKGRFAGTLGVSSTVLNINRVHNPQLEARYKRIRTSMTKKLGKRRIQEKFLYYGPSLDEDDTAVYTNGVDCDNSEATVNGMTLGKGGAFHVNASRANRSSRNKQERNIFLMKCLVDSQAQGLEGAPPSADPFHAPGKAYKCCVDDVGDPKTYVIFNGAQVCPMYMITYRLL